MSSLESTATDRGNRVRSTEREHADKGSLAFAACAGGGRGQWKFPAAEHHQAEQDQARTDDNRDILRVVLYLA